ncbi:hypothetical protein CMU15_00465 [Elizabethkingia anophelis]|nr:hypothetical protein [Elizabethkingia anophelis]
MSEFKGTKGTEQEQRNYGFNILYPDWDSDDVVGFTEQQEEKAFVVGYKQALKDSKAPELLEMLETMKKELYWCINKLQEYGEEVDFQTIAEVNQLIKEATE